MANEIDFKSRLERKNKEGKKIYFVVSGGIFFYFGDDDILDTNISVKSIHLSKADTVHFDVVPVQAPNGAVMPQPINLIMPYENIELTYTAHGEVNNNTSIAKSLLEARTGLKV
ncbi:MAG TPA: hypothetical protein ENG87_05410 [Candidatus Pacearchaeota archaeon]|nr:hypothetical protein [Candidatus Pacearchaeota archaeon]